MTDSVRTEDIYSALFDDDAFEGLPKLLAKVGGGRSSIIQWRYKEDGIGVLKSSYFTEDWIAAYPEFAALDPWLIAGARPQHLNRTRLLGDLVSDQQFEKSVVFNEFVRAQNDDTFRCMGTVFSTESGMGVISVQRGRDSAAFDQTDLHNLERRVTAFERVLRVRGELSAARRRADELQGAVDAVGLAMIVVRASGFIVWLNAAADFVLGQAVGLTSRGGQLVAKSAQAQLDLDQAIRFATASAEPKGSGLRIARGPGVPDYLLNVAPTTAGSTRVALVLFRIPEKPPTSLTARLRTMFGLTAAEAELATALSKGLSPADFAEARGVRASTIKTQLRSLSAKMECRRQSEIAVIGAGLPPLWPE
jgi:DNA-binding CsgD family transcriptional regulator/PAS domain-containing protein